MDENRLRSELQEGFTLEPASEADFKRVARRAQMRPVRQAGSVVALAATLAVAGLAVTVPFRGSGRGGPEAERPAPVRSDDARFAAAAAVVKRLQTSVREQGTFRIDTAVESTVTTREAAKAAERFRMAGDVDLTDGLAKLTMELDTAAALVELRPCTFIATPDAVYFSVPEAERPWLVQGADDEGPEPGRVGTLDPSDYIDVLGGVEELDAIGSDVIRDVSTTHYRGHLDLGRASTEAATRFAAAFDSRIPVDVWVDEGGLPRRIIQRFSVTDMTTGAKLSQVYSADYFDFGEPLDVSAPSPDEVAADTGQDAFSACLSGSTTSA
jgi:hypothetical protein